VRRIARHLPFILLALGTVQFAAAQASFDVNLGFGSFHDKAASPTGTDNVTGNPCSSVTADPNCVITPSSNMGGFFLGFGMDMLLKKNYGIGFQWDLTPAKSNYTPSQSFQGVTETVQYRQHFIDVNGIWAPVNTKKVALKIMPGIGDAKTGISIYESQCLSGSICAHGSQPFTSTNHFDLHAGVGVQVFVTDHIYIQPQFDFHYVPNLTDEFGSNVVVGGMVFVGYSWGDR
jgi:hypothetical protein